MRPLTGLLSILFLVLLHPAGGLDCEGEDPSIAVLSPQNGQLFPLELHGMDLLRVEVELLTCNFHAIDGSISVFGGGEQKIQDLWHVVSGRKNYTIEISYAYGEAWEETMIHLQKGMWLNYRLEFSLTEGGFEIGVSSFVSLLLLSRHIPLPSDSSLGLLEDKKFIYLLSTKHEVSRSDLQTPSSDFLQLVWGPVEPLGSDAIWFPGCTWNEARNRLYQEAKRRGRHYLYFIFTDDDASLSLQPAQPLDDGPDEVEGDPWREYERLLLKYGGGGRGGEEEEDGRGRSCTSSGGGCERVEEQEREEEEVDKDQRSRATAGFAKYTIQQPHNQKRVGPEEEIECVRFADPLLVAYHFEAAGDEEKEKKSEYSKGQIWRQEGEDEEEEEEEEEEQDFAVVILLQLFCCRTRRNLT
eukprot:761632-Hanusia_phi.AAC.1